MNLHLNTIICNYGRLSHVIANSTSRQSIDLYLTALNFIITSMEDSRITKINMYLRALFYICNCLLLHFKTLVSRYFRQQ